jgi:Flp pilus assembly protein TadG
VVRDDVGGADDGQVLLLILCYTVIAALLVTVVVDVSKVFLCRRSLVAASDGASLAAANQPDLASIYRGGGSDLPISPAGAAQAVADYAGDADLAGRFRGFRVVDVTTDGDRVTVTFSADVPMPFGVLGPRHYEVRATSTARSPLSR